MKDLNLKYISWLLKELYYSKTEIGSDKTIQEKPSKSFPKLCMTLQVENKRGLDRDYYPVYTKCIEIFLYSNPLAFTHTKDVDYHISVINIKCDLEEKWEYLEGKDILTITESNYRIEQTSNEYRRGVMMEHSEVESWLNSIKPTLAEYLR